MENLINWFEIPALDFRRAVDFYKGILGLEMEESEMFGTVMAIFPMDGQNVSGAIVKGEGYQPSQSGALLYLNGGKDLQVDLDKVEGHGGSILVPKTQISAEMGYFALLLDTEGNKIGLHSPQ